MSKFDALSPGLLDDIKASLFDADEKEAEGEITADAIRAGELQELFATELGDVRITAGDVTAWRAAEMNPLRRERTDDDSDAKYRGIGGWLSFFIIMTMYVVPALSLIILGIAVANYGPFLGAIPASNPHVLSLALQSILLLAALVWGIIAARRLQTMRPRCVQFTKLALLGGGVLSIIVAMIGATTVSFQIADVLRPIAGTVIWYSYFSVSKRVKATYPDADEPLFPAAG